VRSSARAGSVLAGRFFGSLTTWNAVLLFCAPLAAWLPELPPVRGVVLRRPWAGGLARMVLAAVPVAVVLTLAAQKFATDSAPRSVQSGETEPTVEDDLNFGK
jgi:hypothetical protein